MDEPWWGAYGSRCAQQLRVHGWMPQARRKQRAGAGIAVASAPTDNPAGRRPRPLLRQDRQRFTGRQFTWRLFGGALLLGQALTGCDSASAPASPPDGAVAPSTMSGAWPGMVASESDQLGPGAATTQNTGSPGTDSIGGAPSGSDNDPAGSMGLSQPEAGTATPANPAAVESPAAGGSGSATLPGAGMIAGDTDQGQDQAILAALRDYLAGAADGRPPLEDQDFALRPLSAAAADEAAALLWSDYQDQVRRERQAEFDAQRVIVDGVEMRYGSVEFGDPSAEGRALFISMHGGGATSAATNDGQWRNQVALGSDYNPKQAIWVAPRAPTDDWNMWFKDHIPGLFDRLITNFVVFAGVDENRVYLTGYSAGGDGVYQLGPRMADRWAGAAMSAGHPNDASPLNLRNVPFAIHVGGNDTAFDRNLVAEEWGDQLTALQAMDPDGYIHQVQVHAGLGHWMNLEDAVAIPFLQMRSRDPQPKRVVFRQDGELQTRLYNLAVDLTDVEKGSSVKLVLDEQQVELSDINALPRLTLRLSDRLLDLSKPVQVNHDGAALFSGRLVRTVATLYKTLAERGDPAQMFSAEVELDLSGT